VRSLRAPMVAGSVSMPSRTSDGGVVGGFEICGVFSPEQLLENFTVVQLEPLRKFIDVEHIR
jgi:hypothetical protein